jgi:hypothetical protein
MLVLSATIVFVVTNFGLLLDDEHIPLNTIPPCILPDPNGTQRCPLVSEWHCAPTCDNQTNKCWRASSNPPVTTNDEQEIITYGSSTEIDTYPGCIGLQPNCRQPKTLDIIQCYRVTECKCRVVNGVNCCYKGDTTIFELRKYKQDSSNICILEPID